jgi:ribonuclease I
MVGLQHNLLCVLPVLTLLVHLNISSYPNMNNYGYYMLQAQKWCPSETYNIHGLWPQYTTSSYPSYCDNVSYVPPQGDLLDLMQTNWNSCGNNSGFWEHEWKKHGSCVEKQMGLEENAYFNFTLNLFADNQHLLDKCNDTNCTMGCFDLHGNLMEKCP